ncbi:putative AbiEi antitoxin of type IV toxin-antitoxin system [Promicromonospora sp. AC04]|uniref:type IV toxin-antitoxin system AbiEi family antitoxin domain-containing protein n=1 Tax=Promicromonospora sp. AC04 TaxID=2135723 RepID=UPI000D3BD2AD|nr:type IV toxin-antitoxin system AbiEi family antitoxin domain-containing protein [Promicromonospora sp. AC04]PUB29912.1 putative AbiEi antitoxin of type IV toxin-antitoxin system [Promicromonospora sp. AC04]
MSIEELLDRSEAFRAADARAAGINSHALRRMTDAGQLIQLSRGLYIPAAADGDPDLLEIATRAPRATLCLTSALARHELIDDIPAAHDLALPRGGHRPALRAPARWHAFDGATFEIERGAEAIAGAGPGATIAIYSPARCIVDAFRMRNIAGYETGIDALREWLTARGNHPAELLRIARLLPRAEGPLRTALEFLA